MVGDSKRADAKMSTSFEFDFLSLTKRETRKALLSGIRMAAIPEID
jgi:hypothetical protein